MSAPELTLYSTLTRKKAPFKPIDPANVRMYVCGPTVYSYAHIGNARPIIVFDVLFRLLRHIYGEKHVTYARNITDVDDKINARAAERGIDIRELTEETYNNFKTDVAALGCLPPTVEPRATEHIEEMKAIIERLIASGHAYVAEDNVLFNVPSMTDYGQLSKRPMDEMIAGARVEVAPYKKDAQDFVLWKPSKAGEPGWPSPGGIKTPGRPGWHIECSAMSWKHLGETFDIHGGGKDLIFPHHENEIAQSECAHAKPQAKYWMHNGLMQAADQVGKVGGRQTREAAADDLESQEKLKISNSKGSQAVADDLESQEALKISKSKGSGPFRELLKTFSPEAIRLLLVRTHYRSPILFSDDEVRKNVDQLETFYRFFKRYEDEYGIDDGYPMRRDLYNLYHLLNHAYIFGGGYASQAFRSIQSLLSQV